MLFHSRITAVNYVHKVHSLSFIRTYNLAGRSMLGRYTDAPVELFRISRTPSIELRDKTAQEQRGCTSYDLVLGEDGLVHPATGNVYKGPNGASLRPMGFNIQNIIREYSGPKVTIYRVPQGVVLPKTLVLWHELGDHYSLQTTKPVSLKEINLRLTSFFKQHAESLSYTEFLSSYPMD